MNLRRVLPSVLLLLAACGGHTSPARTAEAAPSASAAPSGAVQAASSPAASGSATPAAHGPTPTPGKTGSSNAPGAGATSGSTSGPGGRAATPAVGAAPGTYTYDSQGTFTAGTAQPANGTETLTLDPLRSGHQHSILKSDRSSTDQNLEFRGDGTFLDSLTLTNAAFTKTFTPAPPVLLVPQPAAIGRSWSWTARSTDGKTTVTVTNQITRTETLTIGTEQVACAVIDSVLTLSGDVTYRGETSTWYSPTHRLGVKTHEKGSGSINGFPFSSDVTSLMRSTTPA